MPPFAALETAECKPRVGWQHDLRLSDAEIATRRGVSVRTVSNQVARALSKTGAANRVALARMSIS